MFSELDIHLPGILLAYSVLAVGILSPGPAVIAIIGTALVSRPGVMVSCLPQVLSVVLLAGALPPPPAWRRSFQVL